MAPKRLSETEKQEIAERYRQPNESTATLSRAFGVSTSTIGRLLKSSFTAAEYDELVQKKRSIGRGGAARSSNLDTDNANAPLTPPTETQATETQAGFTPLETVRVVSPSPIRVVIPTEVSRKRDPQTRDFPAKRRSRTRSRARSQADESTADFQNLTDSPTDPTVGSNQSDTQLGLSLDSGLLGSPPILRANSDVPVDNPSETQHGLASRRRRRRSSVNSSNPEDLDRGLIQRTEVTAPSVKPFGVSSELPSELQPELPSEEQREFQQISREPSEFTEPNTTPVDSEDTFSRTRQRRTRRLSFASPLNESVAETSPQDEWRERSSPMPLAEVGSIEEEMPTHPVEVWTEAIEHAANLGTSLLASPPLSEAILPKTCYLVVDRLSELISRPLQDFEELGEIPPGETQEQTLPIFDNHRVARRFANRSQRVMKIPDSRVLQKTGAHLQAKGITRVLIDGKVYSLS